MFTLLKSRPSGVVLTTAIVGLTLATAYIHFSLGSILFLLNAAGYVGLAGLIVIGAATPIAVVQRFSWFPRVALVGYTLTTIVAWAVIGPYFSLAYLAKTIEVALVGLLIIDVIRVHGSPAGLVRAALASVASIIPPRSDPDPA